MRTIIRHFDAWLSRRNGIFEFSQVPDCIFRLQVSQAHHQIPLPDCLVERGEPVMLIHLWNERMSAPEIPHLNLGNAKTFQRSILQSFREVVGYLEQHPDLADVRAIGGITILLGDNSHRGTTHLVQRLGFTVLPYHNPLGTFGEFWENFYSWILIWTYNPSNLVYRKLPALRRKEFWISIREFQRRFGNEMWD